MIRFIYPYEEIKIGFNNNYSVSANANIIESKFDSTQQIISYELILNYGFKRKNKAKIPIYNNGIAEIHAKYASPLILWIGLLNDDEIPDFIIEENIMEDKCGPPWLNLIVSSQDGENINYEIVSTGINSSSLK